MNYEQKKTEELKRKRRRAVIISSAIAILVAIIFIVNIFIPVSTWKYYFNLPSVSKRGAGELRVHYLDVGHGDATLIELPDGKSVLVDGGNSEDGTADKILRYLNALKIKKLHAIVVTHPESAGVLEKVLAVKGAEYAFCPRVYNYSITPEYASFVMRVKKCSTKEIYTELGKRVYSSGKTSYSFVFLSPSKSDNPNCEYDKINDGEYSQKDLADTSAVFLLEYAGVRTLFMGKASERIESKLMLADKSGSWRVDDMDGVHLKADILKVANHGDNTSCDEEFLNYLGVKKAIISCAKNNKYGYPHEGTLNRLKEAGATVYRTDLDGTVLLTVSPDGTYEITT